MINRRKSDEVKLKNVIIGSSSPITIQSMLSVSPLDVKANVEQAKMLEKLGCDIIRVAIPSVKALPLIESLKTNVKMPVVADIHYDYKLALESVKCGVDKIRINPGNIGEKKNIEAVAKVCNDNNIPIRIGVNGGSCDKKILQKYQKVCADALVESALKEVSVLKECGFSSIVVSIKASDVLMTIEAYTKFANLTTIPLHIGVTEAGTLSGGIVKSGIGIGALLAMGIGDTLRVSLTADPAHEIITAKKILQSLGLRKGINLVSCPTCGRTMSDVINIASSVEERLEELNIDKDITIAVMGCTVNGPEEAKNATIGLACGNGTAVIFKHGKPLRSIKTDIAVDELIEEIKSM